MKLLIVILLTFPLLITAQTGNSDVIYLKNGSILRGKIISISESQSLTLQLAEDTVRMKIPETMIKKIIQEAPKTSAPRGQRLPKPYEFSEKGFYKTIYAGLNPGAYSQNNWSNTRSLGFNASASFGYQFNRWYGVGLGAGVENYYFDHNLFPVFVETKGYWQKKNISPYHSLAVGYAFANAADAQSVKGNLFVHPAVGYRFGASTSINFFADLGLRIQEVSRSYQITQWWDGRTIQYTEDWLYKRLTFRFGIIF
jgi:hypothetical protein